MNELTNDEAYKAAQDDELAGVLSELNAWRETKTKRSQKIPEDLWIKMAELCKTRLLSHVSSDLGVSHGTLRRFCEMLEIVPPSNRRERIVNDALSRVAQNGTHHESQNAPPLETEKPLHKTPDLSTVEMYIKHPSGACIYFDKKGLHVEYDQIDESLTDVLELTLDCVDMMCQRRRRREKRA